MSQEREILDHIISGNSQDLYYQQAYNVFYHRYQQDKEELVRRVIFYICCLTYKDGKRVLIQKGRAQQLKDVLTPLINHHPELKQIIDLYSE